MGNQYTKPTKNFERKNGGNKPNHCRLSKSQGEVFAGNLQQHVFYDISRHNNYERLNRSDKDKPKKHWVWINNDNNDLRVEKRGLIRIHKFDYSRTHLGHAFITTSKEEAEFLIAMNGRILYSLFTSGS